MTTSILPPEMRGVSKVTGKRGDGKSFWAAQMENPALTVFFDFEKKGEGIHGQVHFGQYLPVTEMASGSGALGLWDLFYKKVLELPKDTFTHAIIDNTAMLELALNAEAMRNSRKYAEQYGIPEGNIKSGAMGGTKGVVNYLVSELVCNPLWNKGIQLITVTTHIKPRWLNGKQLVNSFNIKGAERWDELSILTVAIMQGDHPPTPSALVIKEQLGLLEFNGTDFVAKRRLPYRLPRATPGEVRRYLREPADLDHPKQGEMPTAAELQPFAETVSKEQIAVFVASAAISADDGPAVPVNTSATFSMPAPAAATEVKDGEGIARQMLSEGKPLPLIVKASGLTVDQIQALA